MITNDCLLDGLPVVSWRSSTFSHTPKTLFIHTLPGHEGEGIDISLKELESVLSPEDYYHDEDTDDTWLSAKIYITELKLVIETMAIHTIFRDDATRMEEFMTKYNGETITLGKLIGILTRHYNMDRLTGSLNLNTADTKILHNINEVVDQRILHSEEPESKLSVITFAHLAHQPKCDQMLNFFRSLS